MKKITVKGWKADQIDEEASRWHTWCDVEYHHEKDFPKYDADGNVTYFVEEFIKESEKAVYVKLSSGMIDGSLKGWKVWIPKSAVVATV